MEISDVGTKTLTVLVEGKERGQEAADRERRKTLSCNWLRTGPQERGSWAFWQRLPLPSHFYCFWLR